MVGPHKYIQARVLHSLLSWSVGDQGVSQVTELRPEEKPVFVLGGVMPKAPDKGLARALGEGWAAVALGNYNCGATPSYKELILAAGVPVAVYRTRQGALVT